MAPAILVAILDFKLCWKTGFLFLIMSIVCEKLHHNGCRFYIEATYETKKLYVCPCNVWLYCIDSSLGGHLGFHMLINIPSLDLYTFTSYVSVWLKNPDDGDLIEKYRKISIFTQSIEFFLSPYWNLCFSSCSYKKINAFHVIAYTPKYRNTHQNQISMSNIVKVIKRLQIA